MGYFSGLGKTVFVMAQGILGAFGVRIPVSFAMSRLLNVRLFYIGLATPCSTVVQVLLCLLYYAHLARREKGCPVRQPSVRARSVRFQQIFTPSPVVTGDGVPVLIFEFVRVLEHHVLDLHQADLGSAVVFLELHGDILDVFSPFPGS